jgi:hypothetical protein
MPVVKPEPCVNIDALHPDTPIIGLRNIARVNNMFDENGEPDPDRAHYHLRRKSLPGYRIGKLWATTLRLLRSNAESGGVPLPAKADPPSPPKTI